MVDVTKENFMSSLPDIQKSITEADFISLDAEFSGLKMGTSHKFSLFDTNIERFKQIHGGSIDSLIIQLGITAFRFDESKAAYEAKSWTFQVFPDSLCSLEFPFSSSGSSIKFLMKNNFDFNKCFYHGVPFLNEAEEQNLRDDLEVSNIALRLSPNEEDELEDLRLQLSENIRGKIIINCKYLSPHFVELEVAKTYPHLWSRVLKGNTKIEVFRVDPQDRERFLKASNGLQGMKEKFMRRSIGLSDVIRLLRITKKPLVGHNFMIDLAKICHQFIGPLSDSYESFKEIIAVEFPTIFDTKLMAAELRKDLIAVNRKDLSRLLMKSQLSSLYENLENCNLSEMDVFFRPIILEADELKPSSNAYHVAGYDSFITGKVFLYLAQIASSVPFHKWGHTSPLNFQGHLSAVQKYKNKVFAGGSAFPYFDLCIKETIQPFLLHITVKDASITPNKLSNMFCQYGRLEVRQILPRRYILACPRAATLRQILKEQSKNTSRFKIVPYNDRLHSPSWVLARGVFIALLGSLGGLCAYASSS